MDKLRTINGKYIVISISLIAILIIGLYNLTWASENKDPKEIATMYIEALANKDSVKIREMGIKSLGMDTAYLSSPLITLDEAEKKGLLKEASQHQKINAEIDKLVTSQYDSVVNSFGKNAWDNVSFEFNKEEHLDGKIAYVEKKSNKQITEEQYEKLNRSYWEGLAKENGITYEQLFSFDDPELDRESAYKYHTLFIKGLETIPTDTIVSTDYELYRVSLKFNGKTVGEDGMGDYRFYISNQSGKWETIEGLTWDYPLGEPSGKEY